MKYNQNEESQYYGNEYKNMPSLDFRELSKQRYLITANQNEVDWNVVKSICEKHGFGYTIINGTFCKRQSGNLIGYDSEFVAYKKLDIGTEEYDRLDKEGDYDNIRELTSKYEPLMMKLHDCIHELDEETDLVFKTVLQGNYGLFSKYDYSYSDGDLLYSWRYIIDIWHPSIFDTSSKLSKGVYVFMTSRWIKTQPKD